MPSVGYEPTISAREQPLTYTLDRTTTGTGVQVNQKLEILTEHSYFCLRIILSKPSFLGIRFLRRDILVKNFKQFYCRIFCLILPTSYHRIYSTSAQNSHQETRTTCGSKCQPPPLVNKLCSFCVADSLLFHFYFLSSGNVPSVFIPLVRAESGISPPWPCFPYLSSLKGSS